MNELSGRAQAFIVGTVALGGLVLAVEVPRVDSSTLWITLVAALAAALAQMPAVVGPTPKSSYNLALVLYAFSFALLGLPSALVVMIVASLAEWARYRYKWYIQTFNIAALAVAFAVAQAVAYAIPRVLGTSAVAQTITIIGWGVAFILVNHFMVGTVILLARGESFRESGVFEALTLGIDAALLSLGVTMALAWQVNPFASLLVAVPAYLMYAALRIPDLERQAVTDSKTGLFNARYFTGVLQKELERAERNETPLTVVLCDLDLLRNVNNTYGHLAGDAVLVGVAEILQTRTRDYDIVARIGGEEFAIIMPGTAMRDALPHVERLRKEVERGEFEVQTSVSPIHVTMSFGVAESTGSVAQDRDIVHNADLALYRAKLQGRNQVAVASPGDLEGAPDVDTQTAPAEQPLGSADEPGSLAADVAGVSEVDELESADELPPAPSRQVTPFARRKPYSPPAAQWVEPARVAAVAVFALAVFWGTLAVTGITAHVDWTGVLAFAILSALTELLSIEIYARDSSVSTSAAPFVAGVLLFGPVGAAVLALGTAAASMIAQRSPLNRFTYNASLHVIAGMAIIWIERASGVAVTVDMWPRLLALCVVAELALFVITTVAVAWMIQLRQQDSLRAVWVERFSWLWPFYVAFGVAAFASLFGYLSAGLLGLAVFTVPLLVLRVSQEQYVTRTKALVNQLRIGNEQLLQRSSEISQLNEDLMQVVAKAVDLRDPLVAGHSANVARYAAATAEEMGLPAERIEIVRQAGLLHDVGKLGVPESVLLKPDRLTDWEYDVVKRHSYLGARLLGQARALSDLVPAIRYHHEHWDGKGYPNGVRGSAIPLEARILGLADAIEAMASDRPYCRSMPVDAILAETRQKAGTQFDPEVVAAFGRVIEKHGKAFVVNSALEIDAEHNVG